MFQVIDWEHIHVNNMMYFPALTIITLTDSLYGSFEKFEYIFYRVCNIIRGDVNVAKWFRLKIV